MISGTPTTAGTSNFTVQVQDSNQAVGTAPESITVVTSGAASCGPKGGSESLLKGSYAFLLEGLDGNDNPNVLAGEFTADGAGNLTGGEEDVNLNAGGSEVNQPLTAASNAYTVGSDNRGCLILTSASGTAVFRFALGTINSGVAGQGTLVEFDGTYSVGILKLQDTSAFSTAAINGSYAFGFDSPQPGYFATIGSFSASAGGVSSGALDVNSQGNVDFTGASGTPTSPLSFTGTDAVDANGRGTFSFSTADNQVNSVCYVVSGAELYCISSDAQSVNPAFAGKIEQQSGGPAAFLAAGDIDTPDLGADPEAGIRPVALRLAAWLRQQRARSGRPLAPPTVGLIQTTVSGFYAFMADRRADAARELGEPRWAGLTDAHARWWRPGEIAGRYRGAAEGNYIDPAALSRIAGHVEILGLPRDQAKTVVVNGTPRQVRGLGDEQAMRAFLLAIATGRRINEILMMDFAPLSPVAGLDTSKAAETGGPSARLRYQQTKIPGAPQAILVGADVAAIVAEQQQFARALVQDAIPPSPTRRICSWPGRPTPPGSATTARTR